MTPSPAPGGLEAVLSAIKAELRSAMNGAASASMRARGLVYRLNFGVDLPRLRLIASHYTPDVALAQALWSQDVRECRILATLLMPPGEFGEELCRRWLEEVPNAEIAQMMSLHLLARLPYARGLAFRLMGAREGLTRMVGFLLVGRMAMGGELTPAERERFHGCVRAALPTADGPLRKAIHNALLRVEGEV